MANDDRKLNVLVTGAAGRIGTAFWQDAGDRYHLRLADIDIRPLQESPHLSYELVQFDITDLDACHAVCADIDVVLHLAADPSPNADFYGSLLGTNIQGTYNIFQAASAQGCQRVVFASSAQAIEAYPLDRQVDTGMPVRPKNMYGVTKSFGEALAAYYAYEQGLSAIAVRIGHYTELRSDQSYTARNLSAFISRRDLVDLLVRSIEVPDLPFAIVHGISDNRFKRLDLSDTQRLLDYQPQDDAFKIMGFGWGDLSS